jgi:hypothetical protein
LNRHARSLGRSVLIGLVTAVASPGCFDQEATLGLPCTTARACGRRQSCVDGTCQRTQDDPQYCPMQDDIVVLPSELPVFTTELLPTTALDVLGECGSLGGGQALYLWQPPVSGTFAVRVRTDPEYFTTEDVLPPLHLRTGGCQGKLGSCAQAVGGARSFAANQDDVIVLAIDDVPLGLDPAAVGFELAIDSAGYCLTGGELAATVPIIVQGTTLGSENLLQPGACEGTRGTGFGSDIAFSWTAPRDGLYAFTASAPDADVLLYVLGSDCGGAQLACATDRGFSGTASSAVPLVRNQTVVVVVDTLTPDADASFELTIDEAFGCVPASNDLGFQFPPGGLVVHANQAESSPIISCAPAGAPQLLYRWTAPAAAFYTFSTAGSDVAVFLSVLEDSCSGAVVGCDEGVEPELAMEDDGVITLPLDTGESVVLAAAPALPIGQVVLALTQTPCGSQLLATPLPVSEQGTVDPRIGAALECGGNRPSPEDAVFSWRAPSDGVYAFEVVGPGSDVELLLYVQDGSCAGHTLGCEHDAAPKITLELRGQETVAVGIAAPPGADPLAYTLNIVEVP